MQPPRRLVDYPYILVRFDCSICHRRGQARLRRPRKYQVGCGIKLPDIEGGSPRPPDRPGPVLKLVAKKDADAA